MADALTDALIEAGLYEFLRMRLVRAIPVPTPAAGSDWSLTVPAGVIWQVLSVRAQLVTDAVVATRVPSLDFVTADGTIVVRHPVDSTKVASVSAFFDWMVGYGDHINEGGVVGLSMIADFPLLAGWAVKTTTFAIDAGDQWSGITVAVREWSPQQVEVQSKWIGRQLASTVAIGEAV